MIGALQVHNLEASNQRLEIQIRRELDRKCPRDLSHLDKHLRTASVLQQRVSVGGSVTLVGTLRRGVAAHDEDVVMS